MCEGGYINTYQVKVGSPVPLKIWLWLQTKAPQA